MLGVPAKYFPKNASSKIINEYSGVDSWFWLNGSVNPFRGCEHDCAYCDGKAEYYHIENFSSHIRIKTDSHLRLRKELQKLGFVSSDCQTLDSFLSENGNIKKSTQKSNYNFVLAIGGGVCDVYQPAERKFQITRKILKIIHEFSVPISILTKNKLVLRDLSLISKINARKYANVNISIALMNDQTREIFEPFSSSIYDRFSTLKELRKENIHGGVMAMPILPWIGDNEENIRKLVKESKKSHAEFILPSSLTLKPGRNKKKMFSVVKKHFPEVLHLYIDLYKNNNKYGTPNGGTQGYSNVNKLVHEQCKKYRISDRIPRYIPQINNQKNVIISTILHNLSYYLQYVSEKKWREISKYANAGRAIELSSKNIESFRKTKMIQTFRIDEEIFSIINEVIETGQSSLLSEFQDPETVYILDSLN
jgi:DNA repair photolyase